MVIDTFKWMYQLFEDNGVDLIVNCGDLFDAHTVRAEEVAALSEALSYSRGTPEIHLLGNHEILDRRRNFYATALLRNYSHIEVIDIPVKWESGLSFLPYMDFSEAEESIVMLKNDILFSHIDIKGSKVTPQYELEVGVEPVNLSNTFKLVLNGHIHNMQKWYGSVYNIGATTSLSFSDNSDYIPGVRILDTSTMEFEPYHNPHSIRFIKMDVDDVKWLSSRIDKVFGNKVVVKLQVPFEMRDDVDKMLQQHEKVLTYRIQTDRVNSSVVKETAKFELNTSQDVYSKFEEFLERQDGLKYPLENYKQFVTELSGGVQ